MNVPGIAWLMGLGVNAAVSYVILAIGLLLIVGLISIPIRLFLGATDRLLNTKAGTVVVAAVSALVACLIVYGIIRLICALV